MDIPPPPPPGPNPQEASPRRRGPNALVDVGGVAQPPVRADRGRAQLVDHALFAIFFVVSWKISDYRLLVPIVMIFLAFFGDNLFRSTDFLETTVIREPLRPRDYVLLGMLVIAKFNSMLVYGLPLVLLTISSGMHIVKCLFPPPQAHPVARSHLLTLLAVLWLVVLFKYQWMTLGLFLGYVQDMPFTDSDGLRGLYTGKVNGVLLKPHDIGELIYDNGNKYTGYFDNGVKSSHIDSIMEDSNGDVHIGKFKEEKINGFGTFMTKDRKTAFRGEMKDGKPNGNGYLLKKGDLLYEGQFVDAKIEGRGIMTTSEGEMLIGTFHDEKLEGDGMKRGPGRLPLISGDFKDGLPHGAAVSVDKDLSIYFGTFQNGKRHGKGIRVTSKGTVEMGNWTHGILHGQADIIYPGYTFTGEFKLGKKHGRGVMTDLANSKKYERVWKNGEELKNDSEELTSGTCEEDGTCEEVEI